LITVVHSDTEAEVSETRRAELTSLSHGFYRVIIRIGFMEQPSVHAVLQRVARVHAVRFVEDEVTYYLGRETILAGGEGSIGRIAETLYGYLQRNAVAADRHFGIPPHQVVEIGTQVDLRSPTVILPSLTKT
jgi:KUP system potassium uptake protein